MPRIIELRCTGKLSDGQHIQFDLSENEYGEVIITNVSGRGANDAAMAVEESLSHDGIIGQDED